MKYCVAIKEQMSFLWRKINWYVLQIPKANFSYLIWLMICGKSTIYAIFIMVMHAYTKSLSKQAIQNKLFIRIVWPLIILPIVSSRVRSPTCLKEKNPPLPNFSHPCVPGFWFPACPLPPPLKWNFSNVATLKT